MIDVVSNNRRVDKAPKGVTTCVHPFPEIQRSVKVSVAGVAAVQAFEKTGILGPDGIDLVAHMAGLGCIGRGDCNKNNSSSGCLVFDKTPQLAKGPVGEQPIQSLPSSFRPDAVQVFHNDNISCTHITDNTLADFMIEAPHEPSLSALYLLEMPFSRASAFALESASQSLKSGNMIGYSFEKMSAGCGGEVVYAKVDSDNFAVRTDADRIGLFGNNNVQEYVFAAFGESGACYLPTVISLEVVLGNEKYAFVSSLERGKRASAAKVKGIGTLVIWDGKLSGKVDFAVSASPFRLKCEFDGFAGKLGRQPESCPHIRVKPLVQCFPGAYLLPECMVIGILCGFGELAHGFYENWRRFNLQLHSGLHQHCNHGRIFGTPKAPNKLYGGSFPRGYNEKMKRQFLPCLKAWASLPQGG